MRKHNENYSMYFPAYLAIGHMCHMMDFIFIRQRNTAYGIFVTRYFNSIHLFIILGKEG